MNTLEDDDAPDRDRPIAMLITRYAMLVKEQAAATSIYATSERGILPDDPDGRVQAALAHVAWMLDNMPDLNRERRKFATWLGFIQGILWMTQTVPALDDLRAQTRGLFPEG